MRLFFRADLKLSKGTTPITSVEISDTDTEVLGECAGGACPIK